MRTRLGCCVILVLLAILPTASSGLGGREEAPPEVLLPVKQDRKWGFIDEAGKIVIEPQFDRCSSFVQGLARVRMDGKFGYIDKRGGMSGSRRTSRST